MGGGVKKQPHALVTANKTTTKPGSSTINSLSTYAYDATGNTKTRRIDGDTQDLTWDPRNKLTSATSPGIGAVAVTGLAGKCLDVETGPNPDDAAVQVLTCNESKPQQWRITGDTVQALGKCLTAIGGEARLKPCDGTTQQKFTYRTDKTLYNTATQQCVTVPNDNAMDGNDLDIYTCHATPAQQWNFSNTTKYIYDASGNRLIEETGSSRTLYLGEAEITVNTGGQAIDAVRYYNSPGAPTTVRRTNGKTTGHSLSILLTDHHNTATTTVEQTTNQPITRRKSDPYGNPRGTQPTNWPGSRTFLGTGNDDNTTNLTHIGAREYEPTTGRFISVDPVIDITDPLQMNGYTYSHANPLTNSDPTGLKDDNCAHHSNCTANGGTIAEEGSYEYKPPSEGPKGNGGSNKNKNCGFFSKCNLNKKLKAGKDFWNENKVAIVSIGVEIGAGIACVAAAGVGAAATGGAGIALVVGCGAIAGAAGAAAAANWMNKDADHSTTGILKDIGMGAAWGAAGSAAGGAAAPAIKAVGKAVGGAIGKAAGKLRSGGGPKAGSTCPDNSFTAGTLVLMADGTTKPIEDLQPGDKVLATDPETGETATKDVTASILGQGSKNLVEITIDTDGDPNTTPDRITATDKHPFWVLDLATWKDATELQPGQWLLTDEGAHVQIAEVKRWTAQATTVHNLTVADIHTYYVLAGDTPVLVHNCGGRLVSNGTASTATVTPQTLLDDAKALHDTFGVGTRADKGTTVATGQLGGELVYSVAQNGTNRKLRVLAKKLGYARVYETDLTPQLHTDAEQILFNSIDEGEFMADGIVASSRPACGPARQNCAARANDYSGVQLWERSR